AARRSALGRGVLLPGARRAGAIQAIGRSGRVHTRAARALAARGDDAPRLHGASASADQIARIRQRVLVLDSEERAEMPGMDAKRTDLMPAAVILLDTILTRAGGLDLVVCSWALREGVLLDLARVPSAQAPASPAGRRRSVQALATRYAGTNAHGRHVAMLALQLFDALAPDLGLAPPSRELLEYAALLHDIGHAIEHDRHQRHTFYLIRASELLGFSPVEIEVIALVARGHRKQAPRLSDPEMQALSPARRRLVRGLAALLRIADALDPAHFGVIKELRISREGGRLVIAVDTGGESAELELWAAERRVDSLSRLLDRRVVLRARAARGRAVERVRAAR